MFCVLKGMIQLYFELPGSFTKKNHQHFDTIKSNYRRRTTLLQACSRMLSYDTMTLSNIA